MKGKLLAAAAIVIALAAAATGQGTAAWRDQMQRDLTRILFEVYQRAHSRALTDAAGGYPSLAADLGALVARSEITVMTTRCPRLPGLGPRAGHRPQPVQHLAVGPALSRGPRTLHARSAAA